MQEDQKKEIERSLLMHTKVQRVSSNFIQLDFAFYAAASILSKTALVNWWVLDKPPISRVRTCLGTWSALPAPEINLAGLPLGDNIVDSLGNAVSMLIKAKMSQEHRSREKHSSWVSLILALNI